jgi:predicted amidophosphoribosyltransferase
MFESFLDFVFPTDCAVCKIPPSPLCDSCAPAFGVAKSSLEGTPVWYATEYTEPISRILTAYKDQNRTAMITYLAPGLQQAVADAVLVLGPCWICVPPRNSINFRKRGFDSVLSLITAGDKLALRHLPIDDVMTTGSTLKECMRALGAAGYEVAGICVLAKRNI